MKNIYCILCCMLVALIGCRVENVRDIEISSSSAKLDSAFNWAKQKARTYVMTGRSGKLDVSERSAGHDTVDYKPTYWAGYPHRSAFYSRDYCHQMSGAHLLGLHAENLFMLQAFAVSSTPERKWYPYWAINFDGSVYGLDYVNDSCFVREVPAVFELVEKAWKQYLWTGDSTLIQDPALWNFYTRATDDFVCMHDAIFPNGIAEGDGSGNIFNGVATYNESRDLPYIEAGDGIACQYQAYLAYAGMLQAKNEPDQAALWMEKARLLKNTFNTRWRENMNRGGYIRGFDKNATAHTGFGRETSWFMPMKFITDEGIRNDIFLDFITDQLRREKLYNIEAYTYLPDLFFAYNRPEEGWHWMNYIMDTRDSAHIVRNAGLNGDYPEVAYTLISGVVENLLGVKPDAPVHSVAVVPCLPQELSFLEVKNIIMGDHLIDVRHEKGTMTWLRHTSGNTPLKCEVSFYGFYPQVKINGKLSPGVYGKQLGEEMTTVWFVLQPGQDAKVEI